MQYILEADQYSSELLKKVDLMNKIAQSNQHELVDEELITKALAFAKYYHREQRRKSGEPYYTHPVAVANMAMEHRFTNTIICGALLHDVVEDTECTAGMIVDEFGFRIGEVVHRLTRKRNESKISVKQIVEEAYIEYDVDVLIIKLSDRVDNYKSLYVFNPKKRKQQIEETLSTFILLGMYLGKFNEVQTIWEITQDTINSEREYCSSVDEAKLILQVLNSI